MLQSLGVVASLPSLRAWRARSTNNAGVPGRRRRPRRAERGRWYADGVPCLLWGHCGGMPRWSGSGGSNGTDIGLAARGSRQQPMQPRKASFMPPWISMERGTRSPSRAERRQPSWQQPSPSNTATRGSMVCWQRRPSQARARARIPSLTIDTMPSLCRKSHFAPSMCARQDAHDNYCDDRWT